MLYLEKAVPTLMGFCVPLGVAYLYLSSRWSRLKKIFFISPAALLISGVAMNAAVIIANHGRMPAVQSVFSRCLTDNIHCLLTPAARLPFFADVIVINGGNAAMSVGDVCNDIGRVLCTILIAVMLPRIICKYAEPLMRRGA